MCKPGQSGGYYDKTSAIKGGKRFATKIGKPVTISRIDIPRKGRVRYVPVARAQPNVKRKSPNQRNNDFFRIPQFRGLGI